MRKAKIFRDILIGIFVFFLFQPVFILAQSKISIFQHITTKNGLSQNTVLCILKDKRGLVWIGTLNGLNCYNGYNVTVFKNDSTKTSLSNNQVNSICEDNDGNLWIGTRDGLNKYIFKENRFVQIFNIPENKNSLADNYIRYVYTDKSGDIWIGMNTGGLDKLNLKNNQLNFTHYPYSPGINKSVSAPRVNCIIEASDGKYWIGTAYGLDILNTKTDTFTRLKHDPENDNSITNNSVNTIFEENEHTFWIGAKLGLAKFNPKTKTFVRYFADENNPNSLNNNSIRYINSNGKGSILIGTLGGLHQYNAAENNFYRFPLDPESEFKLNNEFVSSIVYDKDGNVWIGTEKGGINKYSVNQQPFYNFRFSPNNAGFLNTPLVNSIFEDSNYLWIGTGGGGLNKYNKQTKIFDYYQANPADKYSISFNFISNITSDSYGNIWFSTWGLGINKLIDARKGRFKSYYFNTANTDSINWNLVSYALEFPKGNLWIGTRLGLSRMDIKTGKIHVLNIVTGNDNPLIRISCLFKDSYNNLWVGSENGLYRLKWNNLAEADLNKPDSIFKYENDPKDKSTIPGNHIVALLEDSKGNIWISSLGFGLQLLKPSNIHGSKASFIHINKKNTQINEIIYGILTDKNQNIWLSTENGLQKYIPDSNICVTYFESDGIQGNQFYWSAYYKNQHGQLYFGGTKGLTVFEPEKIQPTPPIEKVIFTDLKIFNKSVPNVRSKKSILTQHITTSDTIRIKYRQNMFTLEFTGIYYDIYSPSTYMYKLEGFDDDWITTDNNHRSATYTNLQPGSYLFKVKVANRDGIWCKNEAKIRIIIEPEWWQTLLFKFFMVVLISSLILSYYFNRIRMLKKRHQQLEEMVNVRTEALILQNKEILSQKEEILSQRDEIAHQNEQLTKYGTSLEEMVTERTHDLELAKNKAEEADKLKTSFLTNLSHEIRTPMNAIVGFSTLLAERVTNDNTINDWCQHIVKNSNNLMFLIDDIIDFSKIESNQIIVEKRLFNIYDVLNELFDNILIRTQQKFIVIKPNVKLVFDIPENNRNLQVSSDPNRLSQIVYNLVTNAIKFTEQGFVEIGFKPENEKILFWVKDTGIGIDPKNHQVIFERFRKIEDNTSQLYRGTGLGLALVKSLVNLMGGSIWVESEPGKGSTFFFTLPQEISISKPVSTQFNTNKYNLNEENLYQILIAEDEETNFVYLETLLKHKCFTIHRAKNGKEAVTIVTNTNIDIILMDIKMPIMDGIEATQIIKQNHPGIPVIAVTAYALSDEKEYILKSNFDGYVVKPVSKAELYKNMARYIAI